MRRLAHGPRAHRRRLRARIPDPLTPFDPLAYSCPAPPRLERLLSLSLSIVIV